MGVLNVTPDSFFDGGRHFGESDRIRVDSALRLAEKMVLEGATFIDVGGESTRPGAAKVSVQEELDRVIPVVEAIADKLDVVISVDTSSVSVMTQAITAGAGLINDVRALQKPGAVEIVSEGALPVCLMHMQGEPQTMQNSPAYRDVVEDVIDFFKKRIDVCLSAGIDPANIIIDPGFGFGKSDEHNLLLLKHLPKLKTMGFPILVGLSRKSMIGRLLGRDVDERLPASLSLAQIALQNGANILRVHDVKATVDMMNIVKIMKNL